MNPEVIEDGYGPGDHRPLLRDPYESYRARLFGMPCSNCQMLMDAHCRIHTWPCCPRYPQHVERPPNSHNTILRDGPGDGMLIAMAETTHTIVWDSPWRPPEPGEYRRTDDVEDGLAVFRWTPDD